MQKMKMQNWLFEQGKKNHLCSEFQFSHNLVPHRYVIRRVAAFTLDRDQCQSSAFCGLLERGHVEHSPWQRRSKIPSKHPEASGMAYSNKTLLELQHGFPVSDRFPHQCPR
jgi:hypothetical protein